MMRGLFGDSVRIIIIWTPTAPTAPTVCTTMAVWALIPGGFRSSMLHTFGVQVWFVLRSR